MIITLTYPEELAKCADKLKGEYPQFNYVNKWQANYITKDNLKNLKGIPRCWYYILKLVDNLEINYDEETGVITVDSIYLESFLDTIPSERNVVIDLDEDSNFIHLVICLAWRYRSVFYKVWEEKVSTKTYMNRDDVAVTDNKHINLLRWNYPKLCKWWWHASQELYQAFNYKKDDGQGKELYYGKMIALSVVDYGEDKVCCLSVKFSNPKPISRTEVESICRNEIIPKRWEVWGDRENAPYLSLGFWMRLKNITLSQLNNILQAYRESQKIFQDNDNLVLGKQYWAYKRLYFRQLYLYNKENLKSELSKHFKEDDVEKILSYQENQYDLIEIKPIYN